MAKNSGLVPSPAFQYAGQPLARLIDRSNMNGQWGQPWGVAHALNAGR